MLSCRRGICSLQAGRKGETVMILEGRNLNFSYRGKKDSPVLRDISLSLHSGERVGLTAPSGRGKTTLCKLLSGYEQPSQGEVLLDGTPLSHYRGFCTVQMIWQHPELAIDPLLRLKKTLHEAGEVEERILHALQINPAWLSRYPSELSGGELQRFCSIARVLQPSLRFLLCDEITAMLDPITQSQIWDFLVTESQKRNLGLLIVSHNHRLLQKLCTRMIELPI